MADKKSQVADKKSQVQGEGDYEATRQYNERTAEFLKKGKAPPSAAPHSKAEAAELVNAERAGAARSLADGQDQRDAKEMARLEEGKKGENRPKGEK
ncbi:MAG: hypothetical protein ABIX37_00090 [Gammaproteobacteria bacterium]